MEAGARPVDTGMGAVDDEKAEADASHLGFCCRLGCPFDRPVCCPIESLPEGVADLRRSNWHGQILLTWKKPKS